MSKEFTFYANSKYVKFVKFDVNHRKVRDWENVPDFRKKGEAPHEKARKSQ